MGELTTGKNRTKSATKKWRFPKGLNNFWEFDICLEHVRKSFWPIFCCFEIYWLEPGCEFSVEEKGIGWISFCFAISAINPKVKGFRDILFFNCTKMLMTDCWKIYKMGIRGKLSFQSQNLRFRNTLLRLLCPRDFAGTYK